MDAHAAPPAAAVWLELWRPRSLAHGLY